MNIYCAASGSDPAASGDGYGDGYEQRVGRQIQRRRIGTHMGQVRTETGYRDGLQRRVTETGYRDRLQRRVTETGTRRADEVRCVPDVCVVQLLRMCFQ